MKKKKKRPVKPTGTYGLIGGDPKFWFDTSLKIDNKDRINSPEFQKTMERLSK